MSQTDQAVRLVFLGEAGQALKATDSVTSATRRLSASQKEQASTSRQVTAESRHAAQGFRQLESEIGRASRGALAGSGIFRGFGRSIAFTSSYFLGGYGLVTALKAAVDEMRHASANSALVKNQLIATGGAAGINAKQIDVLARATMLKTGTDKQAVVAAEAVLLKYTEVRNEVGKGNDIYTRAVGLSADLAKVNKTDLSASAEQLGKALDNPLRATRSLNAANIILTKGQQEQIKAFAESGRVVEAQAMILDIVASKVGGVAAASKSNLSVFKSELLDLSGEFATVLKPSIAEAVAVGEKWVHNLENDKPAREQLRKDLAGIASAVRDMVHALKLAVDAVGGTKNAVELLIGFKMYKWATEAAVGLKALIGSAGAAGAAAEGAAVGTGLAGASTSARGLFGILSKLKAIGPITLLVELAIHPKWSMEHVSWLEPLAKLIGGNTKGMSKTELAMWLLLGIKPKADNGIKGTVPNPTASTGAAGQAKVSGTGAAFPLPGSPSSYSTRGTRPGVGTHNQTDWQSRNAVDIFAKPDTPVMSPVDGIVTMVSGEPGTRHVGTKVLIGYGVTIRGQGMTYYIAHIENVSVSIGDQVKRGQVIGTVDPQAGHIHFATESGDPAAIFLGQPSTLSGAGKPAKRTPPRGGTGSKTDVPLNLQERLAKAGVTKGAGDDRSALQAIIAWEQKQLAGGGLTQTQRIAMLQSEGGYISQLDSLAPKKAGKASAAALVNIHHTLDAVAKLVDTAGLDKKFDPALDKINKQLSSKFVTSETLAKIRNQLGDISKAATTAIDKAKNAVAAKKKAFADAWAQLASDAFAAFDKETAAHKTPSQILLDSLIGAHDEAARQQALADAKQQLADALSGKGTNNDSGTLDQVRALVGNAALANAVDKAQSGVLGGVSQQVGSGDLVRQLQDLLVQQTVPDAQAVAQAQRAVDEAQYQIRVADLSKLATTEADAYAAMRALLRDSLQQSLDAWGAYYANIGKGAEEAASLFGAIWSKELAKFPIWAGGTSGAQDVRTIAEGFTIPSGVIGAGFGGAFGDGGEGVVMNPTLFLAGDKGMEHYKFTPGSGPSSTSTGSGDTHVHVSFADGMGWLEQFVQVKVQEQAPQTSRSIGLSADRRRREGRFG